MNMGGDATQFEWNISNTNLGFLPDMNASVASQSAETTLHNGETPERSHPTPQIQFGKARELSSRHTPPPSKLDKHKSATKKYMRSSNTEEEDTFVEILRSQKLPWKVISEMFCRRFGKTISAETLQMRRLRRRRSAAPWPKTDVSCSVIS
jgi:hypothetical protein